MDETSVIDNLRKLLSGLEGVVVPRGRRYVPSSGRTRPTEPYLIFEQLVGKFLDALAAEGAAVVREPHGGGQFPDWSIDGALIEVKSAKSKSKRFMVGAVKKMAEAFEASDPKYLQANYVVFYYSLLPGNRMRVDGISIGKIWNYSRPTAARSGRRPQWPSSRVGSSSMGAWMDCYVESTPKRGYPVPRSSVEAAVLRLQGRSKIQVSAGAVVRI